MSEKKRVTFVLEWSIGNIDSHDVRYAWPADAWLRHFDKIIDEKIDSGDSEWLADIVKYSNISVNIVG